MHCGYVGTMNLGVCKITSNCCNLTSEFDGFKIDLNSNVETGRYSGKGIKDPNGTEVEISIAGLIERANTGFTDAGAMVGVDGKVQGVTVVAVKGTINSGVSTSGKGILTGIK